jgi:hypothetical protein
LVHCILVILNSKGAKSGLNGTEKLENQRKAVGTESSRSKPRSDDLRSSGFSEGFPLQCCL